jgi:hypothetical protein
MLGVIAVLATASAILFSGKRNAESMRRTLDEIVGVIEATRQRSVTQEQGSPWGIRFTAATSSTPQSYTVFRGSTFSSGVIEKTYPLSRNVQFTEPYGTSTYDITFLPLLGSASGTKAFSLAFPTGGGIVGIFAIRPLGQIATFVTDRVRGYWHFDESGGANAVDASVNGTSGAIIGEPSRLSGSSCKAGGCLSFLGSGQYISVPSLAISELSQGFTILAWVKTTNFAGGWSWIFSASQTAGVYSWFQCGKRSGNGEIRFETGDFTSNTTLDTTGVNLADGSWHHLACVWDREGAQKYIYVDGMPRASTTAAVNSTSPNYGALYLGAHPGPSEYWVGLIDEPLVLTRALSPKEIYTLSQQLR